MKQSETLPVFRDQVARDIQAILEYDNAEAPSDYTGEETEFDVESHYQRQAVDDVFWQADWRNFEKILKIESRYFSQLEKAWHEPRNETWRHAAR